MAKPKIMYGGVVVLSSLQQEEVNELISMGLVEVDKKKQYHLKEHPEYKHLFTDKIPLAKKLNYFQRMNMMKCTCEDCGAKQSLHIRPVISPDGEINFKKIVCVCKDCRTKALEKQDILVPQFQKNFSNKALDKEITAELEKEFSGEQLKSLKQDTEYFRLKRLEKRTYALTKIPLPPMPDKQFYQQEMRGLMNELGLANINQEVDIEDTVVRVKIKDFLMVETNNNCPCCGERKNGAEYTIDHIHPKSKGGKNNIINFIGLCEDCNKEKDNNSILEFLRRKKFKSLPERILLVAYKDQEKAKVKLEQIQKEVTEYLHKKLQESIA